MASDWQPSKLGDVIAVNPSRPLAKGSDSVYISMQQIETENRSVNEINHRAFKGSGARFQNGDTLLARITPCLENGKTAYVDFLDDKEVGHGSTEFIVLSGIEGVSDDLFVYYLSRYPEFRNFAIVRMEGSSGRQRVPAPTLKKYTFACPSYDEQRAIAHILGSLDDKIELNRRMNQTLEAMARAIFKSWFVDFDPVRAKAEGRPTGLPDDIAALFPDSFEDSEIGKIPKGWGVRKLGNVANVNWGDTSVTKKSYVKEGFLAYSAKGPDGFLPYYDYDRTGVVVSAIGANSGHTWLAQGKWSCIKNTIRFWNLDDSLSTEYLFHATSGKHHWSLRGSAQPFVSQGDARNIKILCPSNNLAKVFGNYVRPFYKKTVENNDESNTLTSLRDTLLPKLISGEIRVPDAEKLVEEAV
jgi:type I restriction enzyme, S subunit